MRYITIMLDESKPKLFGLDKVDPSKTVYITEGPFDSMFIENSVAMCGADVDVSEFGWGQVVYVYDNEPRNSEIVRRIETAISTQKTVVIWDKDIKEKDLNDMVLAGRDVQRVVECNRYHGLEANLKLNDWKRV